MPARIPMDMNVSCRLAAHDTPSDLTNHLSMSSTNPPRVFVSYAHHDADLKRQFDTNLRVMQRQGIIEQWTDGEIQPGDHWEKSITDAMMASQVIIFLVSNNFLDSEFIRNVEAPIAMQLMNEGKAVIVPVLLRTTPGWKKEQWYCLQALPSEVKPVEDKRWINPAEAFADVERHLREMIELLPDKLGVRPRPAPEETVRPQIQPNTGNSPDVPVALDKSWRAPRKSRKRLVAGSLLLACAVGVTLAAAYFSKSANGNASHFKPANHDKTAPFVNSLGMRFVVLPDSQILCSIWELRVDDFRIFADSGTYPITTRMQTHETDDKDGTAKWANFGRSWQSPGFYQNGNHPVVGISLADAAKFCDWLTTREKKQKTIPEGFRYRVIRDSEWSLAAGDTIYPWNPYEISPSRRGNYGNLKLNFEQTPSASGDGAEITAPVGSYDPNPLGIFDLGGNVTEICDTPYDRSLNHPYVYRRHPEIDHSNTGVVCARGGSWLSSDDIGVSTDLRWPLAREGATSIMGYRIVLAPDDNASKAEDQRTIVSVPIPPEKQFFDMTHPDALKGFAFLIPLAEQPKDFEATVGYCLIGMPEKEVGFGIAFNFRTGANARSGYRAFVSHAQLPGWGSGYYDASGGYQAEPFVKINRGMIRTDGSLNRFRVSVHGNRMKVYSNDCLIGEREFDAATLAGDLSLFAQLAPYGNVPEQPLDASTGPKGIDFQHIDVHTLDP
ncbi:MAG: SUMF1/EgtB/PvdO family nonheme iron enzyme [Akkermansiaceae bacterium]|nr:SUMF1/EgtB/PvdO family nonheme iron enzyme [Akkermansiaceae bacterium]